MKTQLIQTRSTPVAPYRQGARADVAETFQLKKASPTQGPIREQLKFDSTAERIKPAEVPRARGIERSGSKAKASAEGIAVLSQQKQTSDEAQALSSKGLDNAVEASDAKQSQKPAKTTSESDQELVAETPSEASDDAQALFVSNEQPDAMLLDPTIEIEIATAKMDVNPHEGIQPKGMHGSMQMAIEAIGNKLEGMEGENPELEGKFDALLSKLEALAASHETKQQQQSAPGADKMKLDKMLSAYGAELVQLSNGTVGGPKLTAQKSEALPAAAAPLTSETLGPIDSLLGVAAVTLSAESELTQQDALAKTKDATLTEAKENAGQAIDTSVEVPIGTDIDSATPVTSGSQSVMPEAQGEAAEQVQQSQKPTEEVKVQEHKSSPSQDATKVSGLVDLNQQNQSVHGIKEKSIQQHKISPSAIMEQVREAILKAPLQQGERSEMVLQLKPEELGKVELKIEVHKDVVIAKFDVASAMVKETIETNLADLKSSLKDKGFSDMTFDVNVSKEKTHEGHAGHGGNGKRRGRGIQSLEGLAQQQAGYTQSSLAKLVGNSQFEHYA